MDVALHRWWKTGAKGAIVQQPVTPQSLIFSPITYAALYNCGRLR